MLVKISKSIKKFFQVWVLKRHFRIIYNNIFMFQPDTGIQMYQKNQNVPVLMHRPHKIIKNKITQNDIMDHRVSIDGAPLYV